MRGGRRFVKGLRYNLPSTEPLACAVLSDTPAPVGLYVVPAGASEQYRKRLAELQGESQMVVWEWDTGSVMPALPPAAQAINQQSREEA